MTYPAEVLPEQNWSPITVPQVHATSAMTDPVLLSCKRRGLCPSCTG